MDGSGSARHLHPDACPFGLAQISASQSNVDLAWVSDHANLSTASGICGDARSMMSLELGW